MNKVLLFGFFLALVHSGTPECRSCQRYSYSSNYDDSPVQYTVRGDGGCSTRAGGCGGGSSNVRYYSTPVETQTVYRNYGDSGCSRAGGCSGGVRYTQPTESRTYYSQPSVQYVQSAPRVTYYSESAPVSYRYYSTPTQYVSRASYQEVPTGYTRYNTGGCSGGSGARCA